LKKLVLGLCALLVFISNLALGQEREIGKVYRIPKPVVKEQPLKTDTTGRKVEVFNRISLEGGVPRGEPGQPVLPYLTARILLPPSCDIDKINIVRSGRTQLNGELFIEPGQTPIPITEKPAGFNRPAPQIYESSTPFPKEYYSSPRIVSVKGYKIALIEFTPFEYIPARRTLYYYSSIEVSIKPATLKSDNRTKLLRTIDRDLEEVRRMIDNPEILDRYKRLPKRSPRSPIPTILPAGTWDMVVVTNNTLQPTFDNFASWRTNRGIKTRTYDIATILSDYSGYDDAEKLRNFVIDAYSAWGIKYLLLGGDVEVVPHRKLHIVTGSYVEDIPADLYFAGLDGTWDSDGDHVYGEFVSGTLDEADLGTEVFVGRAPVNSVSEAEHFCNKIIAHESDNLSNRSCNWLFFATTLDVNTDGGDYKDATESSELPAGALSITKVYQSGGGTGADVIAALNAGQRLGNSCGHGNQSSFGMINSSNVDALTNTVYPLIYTWACWTNAFDQADAIGEHFLYTEHGAFGYIGNSRYGWYSGGDASGSSHSFELKFYNALIAKNIPRLGPVLQDSKDQFAGSSSSIDRWITYALNLMGDPSTLLRLKSDLWIATSTADDGGVPAASPFWTSPDIAVDAPGSWQTPSPFVTHENPEFGSTNRVYVRVHNRGCVEATNVTVRVYYSDPGIGFGWPWNPIGTANIASIPPGGESVTQSINWKPLGSTIGHQCMFATAECSSDPITVHSPVWDNNVAQKNVTIVDLVPSILEHRDYVREFKFYVTPFIASAKRQLRVKYLNAPKELTARFTLPGTIQVPVDASIKTTRALGSGGKQRSNQVDSRPGDSQMQADQVVVAQYLLGKKAQSIGVSLRIPKGTKLPAEFTVRIYEEVNGQVRGGMDYVFRKK
jgi:hypothetical protein